MDQVADRSTKKPLPGDARADVLAETRQALAAGWVLVRATCSPFHPSSIDKDPPDEATNSDMAEALLMRPESDLDHAATAQVRASAYNTNWNTDATTPAPAPNWILRVMVTGYVPFHTETTWPTPQPVDLDATCLTDRANPNTPDHYPDYPPFPNTRKADEPTTPSATR